MKKVITFKIKDFPKKTITFLLCLLTLVTFVPITEAKASTVQGYDIDVSELDDEVSDYIDSFYLQKNEDSYALYINDEYIQDASGNPLIYYYWPNGYVSITVACDLNSSTVLFHLTVYDVNFDMPCFIFKTEEDGSQSVTFYPHYYESDEEVKRIITKDDEGIYDCGTFTYRYEGDSKDTVFTCKLNSNTNEVIMNCNGQITVEEVETVETTRVLYFERHIDAQELELEYMNNDSYKTTYANANSSSYYTDEMIDGLVSGKKVEVRNKQTSATYELSLRRTIGVMNRISGDEEGTGEYEDTDQSTTVVVSYEELSDEDKATFGVNGKSYAIFSDADTNYKEVVEDGIGSKSISGTAELYKNISWEDYKSESSVSSLNSIKASLSDDLKQYFLGEYSYRYALSKTESGYIYESESGLPHGEDYQYQSKTFWQIRNYSWQNKGYYAEDSSEYITALNNSDSYKIYTSDTKKANAYRYRTYNANYNKATFHESAVDVTSDINNPKRNVYRYRIYGPGFLGIPVLKNTVYKTEKVDNYSTLCDTTKYTVKEDKGYLKGIWDGESAWSDYTEGNTHDNYYGIYSKTVYDNTTITKYLIKEKTYTSSWQTVNYTPEEISGIDRRQIDLTNQTHITQWSDWSAYGDYSAYSYTKPYIDTLGITQTKFRYRTPKSTLSPIPGGSVLYEGSYYTGTKEYGNVKGTFYFTKCKQDDQQVEQQAKVDDAWILNKASTIENAYLECDSYDDFLSSGTPASSISYEEVKANVKKDAATLQEAKQSAINNFLGQEIFVPYIYIKSHWRATSRETTFNSYDNVATTITFREESKTEYDDSATLVYKEYEDKRKNCRVVFFDYHDPMHFYPDELPDNWVGYEWLIEEIKNTDFDNPKVTVTITKEDMREMKQWLLDRNYQYEEGEFLKAFKHCFTIYDFPELEELLNE